MNVRTTQQYRKYSTPPTTCPGSRSMLISLAKTVLSLRQTCGIMRNRYHSLAKLIECTCDTQVSKCCNDWLSDWYYEEDACGPCKTRRKSWGGSKTQKEYNASPQFKAYVDGELGRWLRSTGIDGKKKWKILWVVSTQTTNNYNKTKPTPENVGTPTEPLSPHAMRWMCCLQKSNCNVHVQISGGTSKTERTPDGTSVVDDLVSLLQQKKWRLIVTLTTSSPRRPLVCFLCMFMYLYVFLCTCVSVPSASFKSQSAP